jgi:hypothetical protein
VPYLAGLKTIRHPRFDADADGGLTDYVNKLMQTALADRTVNGHLSKAWAYHRWCNDNGLREVQGVAIPKEVDLLFYMAFRRSQGDAVGTVRSLLSALSWHFKMHLGTDPIKGSDGLTKTGISTLLKGLARASAADKVTTRKPITVPLFLDMEKSFRTANPGMCEHDCQAYLTLMSTGIFALLRASEQVTSQVRSFDPKVALLKRDVTFDRNADGTLLRACLLIKAAKNDRLRETQTVHVYATGLEHCPAERLQAWHDASAAAGNQPLYTLKDGSTITRDRLARTIRRTLTAMGHPDSKDVCTHSLRSGGACSLAASSGMSSELLSIVGRWHSDSKELYLRSLPMSVVADAHRQMLQLSTKDITSRHVGTYEGRFD